MHYTFWCCKPNLSLNAYIQTLLLQILIPITLMTMQYQQFFSPKQRLQRSTDQSTPIEIGQQLPSSMYLQPVDLENLQNEKRTTKKFRSQLQQEQNSWADTSSDISYEDDILDDHESALKLKISKNYIIFIRQSQTLSNIMLQDGFDHKLITEVSFDQSIRQMLKKLRKGKVKVVDHFEKCITKEENWRIFLQHIHYSYEQEISKKLLKASFIIWEIYFPFMKLSLPQQDVYRIAKLIYHKLSSDPTIFKLSKKMNLSLEIRNCRQDFLQFFILTNLLTIEKIFTNPYVQRNLGNIEKQTVSNKGPSRNNMELENGCQNIESGKPKTKEH